MNTSSKPLSFTFSSRENIIVSMHQLFLNGFRIVDRVCFTRRKRKAEVKLLAMPWKIKYGDVVFRTRDKVHGVGDIGISLLDKFVTFAVH